MDIQEMRGLIRDVVLYESEEGPYVVSDRDQGLVCDIDDTVDSITEKFLNDGTYDEMKDLEQWEYEEGIHLAALDYFSSYEPVLVRAGVTV